jgi:hypothetical protein
MKVHIVGFQIMTLISLVGGYQAHAGTYNFTPRYGTNAHNRARIDNISTNTVLKICQNENTNIEFSHEQFIVYRKQRLL